ncbi:MAG: LacI family DNA-binding transcriptional regulator [Planctomycetota bacterium]
MSTIVTMKHVADASGVSQATVSQVLNGKAATHRIAKGTQARVRDTAARLGYRRNQSARSMRLGRFMAVGFVVAPDLQYFGFARQPRLVRGLAVGCEQLGSYLRLVTLMPGERDPDAYISALFQELGVDGLVIGEHSALGDRVENAIRKYRVPTLWANEWRDSDCVIPDELDGVSDVVGRFIDLGHRRVAFIDSGVNTHFSSKVRREVFADLCKKAGLDFELIKAEPNLHDTTRQFTQLLQRPDRPTACLTTGGDRAQTLLWAAREANVSVPSDLSIVALDDHHYGNVGLDITFKRIPFMEVGQTASAMLQEKIANPEAPLPPKLVPYGELKEGESLGPAPQ